MPPGDLRHGLRHRNYWEEKDDHPPSKMDRFPRGGDLGTSNYKEVLRKGRGVWGSCMDHRGSFGRRTFLGKNVEKGWSGSRACIHKEGSEI